MARLAKRLAIALVLLYLAALIVLFLAQRPMIFPAPQTAHAPAPGFAAVTLTTADGLTLQAHWRAPSPDRATIVYFHGNAGSLAGAAAESAQLAAAGYGVLLVEYRGYGGNPGAPSEEGFYADGRAAMAFVAQQGTPPARTIIIGNSIGSGTAVQMAREFAPGALILSAPFTGLADVVEERMPLVPARWLVRDRFDNLAKAPHLRMAVLVQHGTADTLIPHAHGAALAKAAPHAALQSFGGLGHDLSFDPAVQAAQLAWLNSQGL